MIDHPRTAHASKVAAAGILAWLSFAILRSLILVTIFAVASMSIRSEAAREQNSMFAKGFLSSQIQRDISDLRLNLAMCLAGILIGYYSLTKETALPIWIGGLIGATAVTVAYFSYGISPYTPMATLVGSVVLLAPQGFAVGCWTTFATRRWMR
jgi:type VI protein secretion system component VasF